MAVDSRARSIDSQPAIPAHSISSQWEALVRQLASEGSLKAEVVENESTSALLSLLSESSIPSPVALDYLRQATLPKKDSTKEVPLVRAGHAARQAAQLTSLPLNVVETVFTIVNAALAATPKAPSFVADTPSDVAQGILNVLDDLILRNLEAALPATETIRWISRFLTRPPHRLKQSNIEQNLYQSCVGRLEATIEALSKESAPPQLATLRLDLALALARLTSSGGRRQPFPSFPIESEQSLAPASDVTLFVADLFSRPYCSTSPILPTDRLQALLRYRLAQNASSGLTPEGALTNALVEFLHAAVQEVQASGRPEYVRKSILYSQVPALLEAVEARAALFGIRDSFERAVRSLKAALPNDAMETDEQVLFGSLCATATDTLVSSAPRSVDIEPFIVALSQHQLISVDLAATLVSSVSRDSFVPPSPSDYHSRFASSDSDELKQALEEISTNYFGQPALVRAICDTIASHAQGADLPSLADLCDTLGEVPHALDIIFLHAAPRDVLPPIREVLDSFDTSQDDFGDNNAIERYGRLVLFVQIVVSRFSLLENLAHHLGSSTSFFARWLPTSSAVYTLPSLDDEGRTAVAGWIGALFGEGISDDLMHATNPRTLLRVAPTILKQSLVACQAGIVDLDSLKDALSYFLQELLSFTLPGVLRWLIGEIARTPPSPTQKAVVDTLQVIIFSDSLPNPVLELVSPDLSSLVGTLSSVSPPPLDLARLKKLVLPFRSSGRTKRPPLRRPTTDAPLPETWQQQLLVDLSALCDPALNRATPSAPLRILAVHESLSHVLHDSRPSSTVTLLLSHLLFLVRPLPFPPPRAASAADLARYQGWLRIERIGAALLSSSSSSSSSSSFPFLVALVREVLPTTLRDLASRRRRPAGHDRGHDAPALERAKTEMLADVVGGAFVQALELERAAARSDGHGAGEGGEGLVTLLLAAMAESVNHAREEDQEEEEEVPRVMMTGDYEDEDADDHEAQTSPALLQVFVDRLLSWPALVEASPALLSTLSSSSSSS
ncbi:hypothetical protein JCM1841_001666 [Sporobolomyces salmonicolor]